MLGSKILVEKKSKSGDQIKVIRTLGWGTYIQVNGLTQSGGIVESIWKSTLKRLKNQQVDKCLILGLGGGSAAKWVRQYWPNCQIIGVDIDPLMVELGKQYLGLDKIKTEIIIDDAERFLNFQLNRKGLDQKFDLILIDIYQADMVPDKFEQPEFVQQIYRCLSSGGWAIFNRLYFNQHRSSANKFAQKLERVFPQVKYFYPEANMMLIAHFDRGK